MDEGRHVSEDNNLGKIVKTRPSTSFQSGKIGANEKGHSCGAALRLMSLLVHPARFELATL